MSMTDEELDRVADSVKEGLELDRRDTDKLVDKGDLTTEYINAELPSRIPGQAKAEQDAADVELEKNEGPSEPPVDFDYPDPNGTM